MELRSIDEKMVDHRYLTAVETGDSTWESLMIFAGQQISDNRKRPPEHRVTALASSASSKPDN
jgi:hypothetical protein